MSDSPRARRNFNPGLVEVDYQEFIAKLDHVGKMAFPQVAAAVLDAAAASARRGGPLTPSGPCTHPERSV